MHQARLFLLLLTPSFTSVVGSVTAVTVLIGITAWHQLDDYPAMRDYFQSAQAQMQHTVLHSVTGSWSALFSDDLTYNILLLGISVGVAGAVYLSLQIIDKGLAGVLELLSITNKTRKKDESRRYGVRVVALVVWLAYLMLTFNTLIPICLQASRTAVDARNGANLAFAFLLLTAAFHVHVILARLVNLRPRLFGNADALIMARVT